jgi:hypothetical protein
MRTYVLYDSDGKIHSHGYASADEDFNAVPIPENQTKLEIEEIDDPFNYYVTPEIELKELNDLFANFDKLTAIPNGIDKITITGIPEGTNVNVTNPPLSLDEVVTFSGTVELYFTEIGKYIVILTKPTYKKYKEIVNVSY